MWENADQNNSEYGHFLRSAIDTTWKVSVFGVILDRIFPHLNWIRTDALYLSVFSPNADLNNSEYGHFLRNVKDLTVTKYTRMEQKEFAEHYLLKNLKRYTSQIFKAFLPRILIDSLLNLFLV